MPSADDHRLASLGKNEFDIADSRICNSRAKIDYENIGLNDKFSNGCMYPGDLKGKPGEMYDCRCTMVANIVGYKYANTYTAPDGEKAVYRSFKEWQAGKMVSGNIYLVNHANSVYNADKEIYSELNDERYTFKIEQYKME